MELLTLPTRELSSCGSSGAERRRATLVREPQDGFAVGVVRLAPGEGHASGSEEGLTAVVVQCRARPLAAEEVS